MRAPQMAGSPSAHRRAPHGQVIGDRRIRVDGPDVAQGPATARRCVVGDGLSREARWTLRLEPDGVALADGRVPRGVQTRPRAEQQDSPLTQVHELDRGAVLPDEVRPVQPQAAELTRVVAGEAPAVAGLLDCRASRYCEHARPGSRRRQGRRRRRRSRGRRRAPAARMDGAAAGRTPAPERCEMGGGAGGASAASAADRAGWPVSSSGTGAAGPRTRRRPSAAPARAAR